MLDGIDREAFASESDLLGALMLACQRCPAGTLPRDVLDRVLDLGR